MRTHLVVLLIAGVVLTLYFNGFFIPKPDKSFSFPTDARLRQMAQEGGLGAVPRRWQAIRTLVDHPANPVTSAKVALGKKLFFDPILSKDRTINCASCHHLEEGGDDNRPTAVGYHGQANPKHLNAPTVLNAALAKREFWDGRSPDVEDQAKGPIQAPFEMAMTPKEVVERLKKRADYVHDFAQVFPKRGITFDTVAAAIGAYERTLLTRGAFDRYLDGDDDAIDQKAKKGLYLFIRIGCKGCHTGVSVGGQSLQHFPLRRYNSLLEPRSVYVNGERYFAGFSWQKPKGDAPYPFADIGGFHGKDASFLFRVPILRNVTETAPYFHNGSVEKLEDAVRMMARHQLGLTLSREQIGQIVAFLKTLRGDMIEYESGGNEGR